MSMRLLTPLINWITLGIVFLIPYQARWILVPGQLGGTYWEYGTQSLYATEALLGMLLVLVIIKAVAHIKKHGSQFLWQRLLSPSGAVAAFLLWAGISILYSTDRAVAFEHWSVLVLAGALFLIIQSGSISFKQLSWAIIFSATLQAVCALWQFFSQEIFSSTLFGIASQNAADLGVAVVETTLRRWLRAYGSFPHPNMLGGFLVVGILLLVIQLKNAWNTICEHTTAISRRPYYAVLAGYVILIILVFGLLATFSRSAWMALGIFLFLFMAHALYTKAERIVAVKVLLVSALCVGVFAVIFNEPFLTRLSHADRLEIKSTQERISGIAQARSLIYSNPLIGVGIGNYGIAQFAEDNAQQHPQPAWYYQPVHNVALLAWAELGIIGLFLLLCIPGALFLRLPRGKRFEFLLYTLPFAPIVFFDHYLWSLYPGVLMGVVIAGVFYLKLAKN